MYICCVEFLGDRANCIGAGDKTRQRDVQHLSLALDEDKKSKRCPHHDTQLREMKIEQRDGADGGSRSRSKKL